VVGDDAQSIYSFRAATVRNVFDFPDQFTPKARVIKLERNYRSTQPILDACNAVMNLATEGFAKNLWSRRTTGRKPWLTTLADEQAQARYVAARILRARGMTIAMFSFYFGMTGVFITRIMHLPDWIALLPALALGYLGMKATQSAMNFAIAKMRVSSNFSEAQIVGKTAQVSISIPAGKLGEIVYLVGQSRQTAPARTKPGVVLSKDSEVIITDVQDGVFYVEGWNDEIIDTTIETIPKPEKTPG